MCRAAESRQSRLMQLHMLHEAVSVKPRSLGVGYEPVRSLRESTSHDRPAPVAATESRVAAVPTSAPHADTRSKAGSWRRPAASRVASQARRRRACKATRRFRRLGALARPRAVLVDGECEPDERCLHVGRAARRHTDARSLGAARHRVITRLCTNGDGGRVHRRQAHTSLDFFAHIDIVPVDADHK